MHIHGHLSIQDASFYSAGLQDRAAAAARATEVRKRLLKSAQGLESEATPEETLTGHWLDTQSGDGAREDEYCGEATGRDPDFG